MYAEANIAGTRRQRDDERGEGLAMRQPRGSPTNRRDCKSSGDQIVTLSSQRAQERLLRADAAIKRKGEREK